MTQQSKIRLIAHPHAIETMQSRMEYAHITGQEIVENSYWFEHIKTGQTFYDIFACIGYPPEITDKNYEMVGYVGVIGIVKKEGVDPKDAYFQILDERTSKFTRELLDYCVELREMYGYHIHPNLLKFVYGDTSRYQTVIALKNARLKVNEPIAIADTDDFDVPKIFDQYVRSVRECLTTKPPRLYFGKNRVLRTKLAEFQFNEPCVLAAGGLVHTLLSRAMWMGSADESVFNVDEDN